MDGAEQIFLLPWSDLPSVILYLSFTRPTLIISEKNWLVPRLLPQSNSRLLHEV